MAHSWEFWPEEHVPEASASPGEIPEARFQGPSLGTPSHIPGLWTPEIWVMLGFSEPSIWPEKSESLCCISCYELLLLLFVSVFSQNTPRAYVRHTGMHMLLHKQSLTGTYAACIHMPDYRSWEDKSTSPSLPHIPVIYRCAGSQ